MTISSSVSQIAAVREFNRFYTARLGLLRRRHLDSEFSLTEARLLYEIHAAPQITATALRGLLALDRGYLSRLLSALTRRRLVRQQNSQADGRERLLTLTSLGQKKVTEMDRQSSLQIQSMMDGLSPVERETVVSSLSQVRSILDKTPQTVRIVRLASENKAAREILEEYYEAVHVVMRDKPGAIQKIIDEDASGVWLAYLGDEAVGCVVLRRMAAVSHAGECKRLYVRPAARGHGIADRLLDAQEEYARSRGVEWIYLDSYDDLKAAIALYRRRGYKRCRRYNDNPQATVFMRKRIGAPNKLSRSKGGKA